ncbi:AsmA-like C-terminal domain-containing protein [Helicobacter canadensis]|uniref:YhdP family protein n=2 Tax=Helicobacter canadensis TaxID=123841 RepID=UPI0002D69975|nr:AsmA-like C-terminal domain-containing protein [Helicobacter canadensis]STO99737.1 Putative periplasmic protein [Helicobacter canadensis]
MLYTFLYNGIKIQQLKIAGVEIEEFYLRLDKKLILEIQTLNLSHLQTSKSTSNDIKQQIQYVKNIHLLLQYFQKIEIRNIIFNNYQANLSYDGKHFLVNLPQIYAKLNMAQKASQITIDFEDIYLKEYGIYYRGSSQYNLIKQTFNSNGKLNFLNRQSYKILASLDLNLKGDFKKVIINGSSDTFKNINFLLPLLPPFKNQLLKEWIFNNYQITSAQIKEFSLTLPLDSKNLIKDSLDSLYVVGEIRDAKVTFQKGLSPILSPNVKLIFQNNTLEFHPNQPTYEHINLQGSQVAITNIFQIPTLEIFIQTRSTLDDTISNLLKSYHISLPIKAPKTQIDANLALKFNLKNDTIVYNKGIFKAQDAQILFNALEFDSKNLLVNMENHLIEISTQNTSYKDLLLADFNFILDTNNKTINGDLLAHSLILDHNSPEILTIQNQLLPFEVNFSNVSQISFDFPTINLEGNLQENSSFKIKNLSSLLPFSKILQDYQISNGEIQITTKDFKEFLGDFLLYSNQQILHDKNHKPIESMQLNFHYTPNEISLSSNDSTFKFHKNNETRQLELTNLIIALDNIQTNTNSNVNSPLLIIGKNSPLEFKNHTILSDSFSFSFVNDELKATLKHKNGQAQIYKKGDYITLDAKEFGDTFVNALANKNIVTQGRFSINANTNPKGALIGKLGILNTNINQLSILQNLMAFIDTIPSLLTFKTPGFNNQGYYLEEGNIIFGYNQDFLAIENLDFKGSSIDIQGKGIISLKNQNIDFYAQLITAKSLSGIINKIPLVNYILLGKEGKISTGFSITGDLKNPTITTKTAQDILLSPFNILKRVITSPFEIFN